VSQGGRSVTGEVLSSPGRAEQPEWKVHGRYDDGLRKDSGLRPEADRVLQRYSPQIRRDARSLKKPNVDYQFV